MRRNARRMMKGVMAVTLCVSGLAVAPAADAAPEPSPGRNLAGATPVDLTVLGATTLSTVGAASTNPVPAWDDLGFSQGSGLLWESDEEMAADLDGMVAAGASWVGADVDWPSIQAGGPNSWNWGPTDRLMFHARVRGLNVMAAAVYTPTWARPANTTDKHAPNDPAAYATFVAEAAKRYAPIGVKVWQLWNEPNMATWYGPQPDPAGFAQLLIQAADAIHAAVPDAFVMNGGFAPAANVPGHSIEPNQFLLQLYQNGIAGHLDAVATHPYTFPYSPNVVAEWNPLYMLGYMHLIMTAFGDGNKEIWATEAGYGTGNDGQSVDEGTQAFRMTELIDAWHRLPYAGTLMIYGFRDTAVNPASVWDNMGLVRRDFSAKLAYNAFQTAAMGAPAGPRQERPCIGSSPIGSKGGRRQRSC